jgi:hypothetical protein
MDSFLKLLIVVMFLCGSYGSLMTEEFYSDVYILKPMGTLEGGQQIKKPQGNIAIISVIFDVIDFDTGNSLIGTNVSTILQKILNLFQIYIHHIVLETYPNNEFLCPQTPVRWISGTGNATTAMALPYPYANILGDNQIWYIIFDIINDVPVSSRNMRFWILIVFRYLGTSKLCTL